ncbi:hypothetical protein [Mitsuaria sp. GD03876]|uniref:hypothetical protein n=1 Tax=Mitsuaria sp. GD03876 TaxID=2975399 RepID=UPI00244AA3FD|nr:hypothetical protein [Mitsuaria sp. GD03876]MDH0863990.1 hypothetical protein [Mitsuaria sp. GD03876]
MKWFRWRFGQPTAEDVVQRVVERLNTAGASIQSISIEPPEIRFALNGGQMQSNLHHLYQDLCRATGRERDGVLQRFVEGVVLRPMWGDRPEDAQDYASIRATLLPLLRTRADIAKNALNATQSLELGAQALASPANDTPWRAVAGDYVAMLGLDTPQSTARVTQGMLDRWGVSFEAALEDALANLRDLPEGDGWRQLAPGLWQGAWNDSYEPSRVLAPDLIYRSGVAHPVVLVPLRHVLLVADANDLAGLALMAAAAKQWLGEQTRWLSCRPLHLVDREWQPFEVPEALRSMFQELVAMEDADAYAAQKRLLEAGDAPDGDEAARPFVSSAQLLQFKDSERVVSYSVWPERVDTLLPHTDLVAFTSQDKPDEPIFVWWADAERIAGHYMVPQDLYPPRMRVRAFPTEAERAALGAVKVV